MYIGLKNAREFPLSPISSNSSLANLKLGNVLVGWLGTANVPRRRGSGVTGSLLTKFDRELKTRSLNSALRLKCFTRVKERNLRQTLNFAILFLTLFRIASCVFGLSSGRCRRFTKPPLRGLLWYHHLSIVRCSRLVKLFLNNLLFRVIALKTLDLREIICLKLGRCFL